MDNTTKLTALILLSYSAYTDIKNREIMMIPVIITFITDMVSIVFSQDSSRANLIGMIPGEVILLISFITKGKIGDGDAYLMIVIGLVLGIRRTLILMFIASAMAAVWAVAKMCIAKADRRDTIPFAPFLLSGYMGVLLFV